MKNASAALIALLNTATEYYLADLLTIIPATGSPTYLTSAATDITIVSQVDGLSHTFKSGGVDAAGVTRPTFARGPVKTVIGTEVDALALTMMCSALATVSGFPWTVQAANGYFDGALVALERAFTATWGVWTAGTVISFWGRVGKVTPTRNTISLTVDSDMILLKRPMPRNLWQPGCIHNVYDAGCAILKATFTVAGAAASGSTASLIRTNLTAADEFYEQGAIEFTSGVNNGLTRTVKTYINSLGRVTPTRPFPSAPANGDTFTIFPGCDKTQATCAAKFSNLAHFRGFPYVPSPESGS